MNRALVVKQAHHQTSRKSQLVRLSILLVGMVLLTLLSAPQALAVIGRHGEKPPRPDYPNPIMATRLQAAHRARNAGKPISLNGLTLTGTTGTQPCLIILVQNKNANVTFDPKVSAATLWSARLTELARYYREVSGGQLQMTPAAETFGTANDGVIGPVDAAALTSTYDYENDMTGLSTTIAIQAIQAANTYINFATFDKNGDGKITADELHLIFYTAGYEASYDTTSPTPRMWGHMEGTVQGLQQYGLVPATDSDNKILTSFSMIGSEFYHAFDPANPTQTTFGSLPHEVGHDLGLPDSYDTDYETNGGWGALGGFCLMAAGSWGGVEGSTPCHISGFLRDYLFWTRDIVLNLPLKGDRVISLTAADGTAPSNVIARLNIPNSNEFFIVENRQFTGYDAGMGATGTVNPTTTPGGLAIYHCDGRILGDTERMTILDDINAYPADPAIKLEEADGLNSLMDLNGTGSPTSLWRQGTKTSFNELTNPNSNLKSGVPSQVDIFDISASGKTMTFTCGSSLPRASFAVPQLNVLESAGRMNVVVNLSQKSENLVTLDYGVSGGSARNGVDYTNLQGTAITTGTLYFYPGEVTKYIPIQIVNDFTVEPSETINLILGGKVTGANIDYYNRKNTITIVDNDNPYLNLMAPNGGEVFARGSKITVRWNANKASIGAAVMFDLYRNGTNFQQFSASTPSADGANSAQLTIPAGVPVGFNYRIVASSALDPSISDQSDNDFAIIDGNLKVTKLAINGGAATAANRLVTLNNTVGSTASDYMASELASFADAQWRPYSTAPQFTLSEGDGVKTVYFKVRNSAGQVADAVSDTIVLKESRTPPVVKPIPAVRILPYQPFTGPVPVLLSGNIPVYWSLVRGPAGMRINPATGVVSWDKPLAGANPYAITIRARNNYGMSDLTWTLQVDSGDLQGAMNDSLDWTTPAGTSWYVQSAVTHDGASAARSGAIGNNQRSVLTTTVTGPGFLSFWWKISSEANWDQLAFTIAGEQKAEISGEQDWQQLSYAIPDGTYTLEWVYSKNANTAMGTDAAFLDQVSWSPQVRVTGIDRKGYQVMTLRTGAPLYSDRSTTVKNTAASPLSDLLTSQVLIKTRDADRRQDGSRMLSFTVDQPVTALLALDSRLPQPKWAKNFQPLSMRLETTEASMKLYAYRFPAGKITLGGNVNGSAKGDYRMYSVILLPATPVPVRDLSSSKSKLLTVHDQTLLYTDTTSVFKTPLPALFLDRTLILTPNADRNQAGAAYLSFDVERPVSVVLALDSRLGTPPSWAAGWQVQPDRLSTSAGNRTLYVKRFPAGRITLGGNVNAGKTTPYNMYSVLVMPTN